jgi:signal transduction histidine kinase
MSVSRRIGISGARRRVDYLVRLIVERAGGRVSCESEEGRCATFAFVLPAMLAEKEVV